MEIVVYWFLLSVVVARAADSRRRSGSGWLLLSIAISPLLAGLLLLLVPKPNNPPGSDRPEETPRPARIQKPRFEPDGVYGGIPYKVSEAGAVEVLLSGGRVRFRNMEQFLALAIKNPNLGKPLVEG